MYALLYKLGPQRLLERFEWTLMTKLGRSDKERCVSALTERNRWQYVTSHGMGRMRYELLVK
jgi:hypothetical protein